MVGNRSMEGTSMVCALVEQEKEGGGGSTSSVERGCCCLSVVRLRFTNGSG